jgi:hypothetical protein
MNDFEFEDLRVPKRKDWRDVLKCDPERCELVEISEILDQLAFVDFSGAFRGEERPEGKVIAAAQLSLQYALQSLKHLEKMKENKAQMLKRLQVKTARVREKVSVRRRDRVESLVSERDEINHILGLYQEMLKTLNPTLYAHVQQYEEEQEKLRKERDEKRASRLLKRGEEERRREEQESAILKSRDEALSRLETQRKEYEVQKQEWKAKEQKILASLAESESKATRMEIEMLSSLESK